MTAPLENIHFVPLNLNVTVDFVSENKTDVSLVNSH